MHIHKRGMALTLIGLLGAMLLFASCRETDSPQDTESVTEAETVPAETDYTVTVKRFDGTPISDIIVKLQQDGKDVVFKLTDKTGSANFKLPTADYTVVLDSPTGDQFHYADAHLTAEVPTLELSVYAAVGKPFTMAAPSKVALTGGYVDMDAYDVKEGTTYTPLHATDHTYLVFNPTRSGYYEITCSEGVDFSYHGMPILISDEPRMAPIDGVITIPVEEGSLGDDSISRLVFRLNAAEGSDTTEALFTITYKGALHKTEEELASWTILEADSKALVPYEGDTSGTLTDVNITAADVKVVLGPDGYYHHDSETGPVVFLRISSENPYTQSFAKMCETDRIRAYLYDENGKFIRKEGYSELIMAYAEFANDDGLVPLNDQLIYVLKNAGNYMGWWDYAKGSDIFGDLVVPAEVAWMFACAYYKK